MRIASAMFVMLFLTCKVEVKTHRVATVGVPVEGITVGTPEGRNVGGAW